MKKLKEGLLKYYEANQTKVDIAFFLAGFVFDVFTLSETDDILGILQQVLYLALAGFILVYEMRLMIEKRECSPRWNKYWAYAPMLFHFMLGGLLSVYSLFFLKSSSFFSSLVFVLFLAAIMVANEIKSLQKRQGIVRVALYVICVLSFFSILCPVILGFVGLFPTLLALLMTVVVVYGVYRLLLKPTEGEEFLELKRFLKKNLLVPSGTILSLFLLFYSMGWIPPVPLSVQFMGVYHNVEKVDGKYVLSYQTPWWQVWKNGDQDFRAQPGDKIYFFASVFSPASFSDSVILHWYYKDPRAGWMSTDRIPMQVSGGRAGGYRGFSVKQNYSAGEWRVSVETTDGREMGRLYLIVENEEPDPYRTFSLEYY